MFYEVVLSVNFVLSPLALRPFQLDNIRYLMLYGLTILDLKYAFTLM